MKKNRTNIFNEMRRIEIKTSKDVKKTADKINQERREKLEKPAIITYSKEETKSFKTDLELRIVMKEHVKNGSCISSA